MGLGMMLMNGLARMGAGHCNGCDQNVLFRKFCGGAWVCPECGSFGAPFREMEVRN